MVAKMSRLALLFIPLALASCSRDFQRVKFDANEAAVYENTLSSSRQEKDTFFRANPASPLTADQKVSFQQLNYYPPNLDLIFKVTLVKEKQPERVDIEATGGEMRPAMKVGQFKFEVGGKVARLFVYEMLGDGSGELFVPFTDLTCGKTSYAGGRYIDLKENSSETYTLDFNYAYNPYCAYNHDYSCPIVPQENHLDVPITAGEMKY